MSQTSAAPIVDDAFAGQDLATRLASPTSPIP